MFATAKSRVVAFAAFVLGSIGTAHAVPYTWTDSAGTFGTEVSVGNPYSFQHNITDGPNGYQPGVDSISHASLSIALFDDNFFGDLWLIGDKQETVGFRLDGGSWTSSRTVDSIFWSWDDFDFTVTSLLSDGILNVVIRANSGDFRFAHSLLTVRGDHANAVPEPATLTMFGFGVLAMGFAARRRSRQSSAASPRRG